MLRQARASLLLPLPSTAAAHSLWHRTGLRLHLEQQQQVSTPAALPRAALSAAAAPADDNNPPQAAAAAALSDAGPAATPPKPRQTVNFCTVCGGSMELVLPEGDSVWRHVCSKCRHVHYINPKMVVGCIVQHEGRILLCRRGIEPQKGLWTVPAGFMECGESSAAGAARETWEEAGARVDIEAPYCHFDIPGISQAYILFRGRLAPPFTFAAQQPESLEARLFAPEDIPFDQLAFSSVAIALRSYLDDLASGQFSVHHGVIVKRPGSGPNEPGSFQLTNHYVLPTTLPST